MKDSPQLYPLKFRPILKEKIWGGTKLHSVLNKESNGSIGESWEISGVEQEISIVENGLLKGKGLDELLSYYQGYLVGDRIYQKFGNTFPLLFKFIDASDDLSVQVHPGDSLAKERHNSFGKSEMWHVLQADENAKIIVGFEGKRDKKKYVKALAENKISEILNSISVEKGDTFIIHPGTVHAIGAGVLLAEIQQTSDITYRIYDWDRPDTDGKMRSLHTELALAALDFSTTSKKMEFVNKMDVPVHIGKTEFFSANKLDLSQPMVRQLAGMDSFVVYMCLEGKAIIETDGFSEPIQKGTTILIPAEIERIKITTKTASFLEVYIP